MEFSDNEAASFSDIVTAVDDVSKGIAKVGDTVLDEGWITMHGGFIGLIFWLSSALSTLLGASTWDALDWVKGKATGKNLFCYKLFENGDACF